jgi:hypothetical protein
MRVWLLLLGGLLVWTSHFFAIYAAASLFPGTALARYLTVALTVIAATAAAWLLWRTGRATRNPDLEPLTAWTMRFAAVGSGLALIAILYQGAPALLV